jgi:agmatinase
MGHPYRAGIAMVDAPAEIEADNLEARRRAEPIIAAAGEIEGAPGLEADLAEVNRLGAAVDARVRAEVDRWLDAGKIVGVVGGDHSVALGAIEAHASRHPALSVLHVDAHADLRVAYEGFERSHASIMHNVLERTAVERLVQVGVRDLGVAEHATITESDRIRTHFDAHLAERRLAGDTWAAQCEAIVRDLTETVYVSFDIDGLDPKLCPHTGTPVPGGLSFAQARFLLAAVAESGRRIVGFDLSEVAPGPDGDEWDGNVGARILYQLVGWTLRSREPS